MCCQTVQDMKNPFSTTITKAFDILECFKDDTREIAISDIASQVSLPVSSVHRIIQTLEFEGLLLQNLETRKYRLGTKLISLSYKCNSYPKQLSIATKLVDELGQMTSETVNLAIGTCDSTIHIHRTHCPHILRPTFPLNIPFPAHCTAVGRIFLAEMEEASQRWIYSNNSNEIDMTEEEFLSMLNEVRKQGYALDDESFSPGLRCVAAPVRLSCGSVAYAISLSAPLARMNDEAYDQARQLVMEYGKKISSELETL